jgi:hypothetical protein
VCVCMCVRAWRCARRCARGRCRVVRVTAAVWRARALWLRACITVRAPTPAPAGASCAVSRTQARSHASLARACPSSHHNARSSTWPARRCPPTPRSGSRQPSWRRRTATQTWCVHHVALCGAGVGAGAPAVAPVCLEALRCLHARCMR